MFINRITRDGNLLLPNSAQLRKAARNELLTTLLESVRDLNFTTYIESGLDVFGICYEYLIKMYFNKFFDVANGEF